MSTKAPSAIVPPPSSKRKRSAEEPVTVHAAAEEEQNDSSEGAEMHSTAKRFTSFWISYLLLFAKAQVSNSEEDNDDDEDDEPGGMLSLEVICNSSRCCRSCARDWFPLPLLGHDVLQCADYSSAKMLQRETSREEQHTQRQADYATITRDWLEWHVVGLYGCHLQ